MLENPEEDETPAACPVETDEEYDARLKEAGVVHLACIKDPARRGTPEHEAIKAKYDEIKQEGRPSQRNKLQAGAQALAKLAGVVPSRGPAVGLQERLRSWQEAFQAHNNIRVAMTPSVLETVSSWTEEPAALVDELTRSNSDHYGAAHSVFARNRVLAGIVGGEDEALMRTASLPVTKCELSTRVRTDWSAAWMKPAVGVEP